MNMPRGVRNNNPGNIRLNPSITWMGQIEGTDQSFCTFDTPEDGIRALAKIVVNYQIAHHLNTVENIINRWAPPVENNTMAYVNAVSRAAGVQPTDQIDVTQPTMLASIVTAIIQHENGEQPYDVDVITNGVQEALT